MVVRPFTGLSAMEGQSPDFFKSLELHKLVIEGIGARI
jgi:hypothetical protein